MKLQDGAGVARLDTMTVEVESGGTEDRTDWYTIECETVYVGSITEQCTAFVDCYITHVYFETRCWTFGGGGGGGGGDGSGGSGSGGNGSGSGGSGSGGSGSGSGGSGGSGGSAAGGGSDTTFYNPNQPVMTDILNGWTPINLFQHYEAHNIPLPLGYEHLRDELIYLYLLYNLSEEHREHLVKPENIALIPYLYDFSNGPQNGEEAALVVPVLDFVMEHGLNADQYIYLFTNQDNFFTLNYIHDICQLDNNQISWLCDNPIRIPESYEFVTTHNTSDKHLEITKGAVKGYIDLLSSNNEEINQFINHIDGSAIGNPIWEIIKEQAAALLTELLAGYLPGGTIITVGPELLSNIEQGNYLEAFWNAIDIALSEADNFVPALKFASFSFAVIKNADKLSKFYNVLVKMQNLGDDVVYRTYLALRNRIDDVYSNFEWISNDIGARISNSGPNGIDPLSIWDDLVAAFDIDPLTISGGNGNELIAEFILGGSKYYLKFYPNSSTPPHAPTIVLKKGNFEFKMRFY